MLFKIDINYIKRLILLGLVFLVSTYASDACANDTKTKGNNNTQTQNRSNNPNQSAAYAKSFCRNNLNITISESTPPTATNVSGTSSDNSVQSKYRWVVIQIETQTVNEKTFIDDITLDVELALVNKSTNNVNEVVLFTGQIEYWNISLDGKKHYYTALLPGKIFNRYVTNDNTPRNSELYLSVKFLNKGILLAEGYQTNRGSIKESELQAWFAYIKKARNYKLIEVPNSILGRLDTSWNMIGIDKYEYEKKK